jgi:hypothetical protein
VPLYHYCDDNELQVNSKRQLNTDIPNDIQYVHNSTSQIIEELRSILTEQLEESKAHSSTNHHNKSKDKSLVGKDLKLVSTTHNNSMNVKEMPLNPFDFIWYANNLVPKQDEIVNKVNLPEAMYEEYALYKNKSMLSDYKSNNNNNSNWSFSSSNNPLFSDDYTLSSRASKCDMNPTCGANMRKKKEKKFKLKKKKAIAKSRDD